MDSSFLLYQTQDGLAKVEVKLENETVWLSLKQMSELFQRDKSVVSRHIRNIFKEGELQKDSVVANIATTASDGKNYNVNYYNLDVIISVGYRVKSLRGTQFRIWATKQLKEYLIKGFLLNDARMKEGRTNHYFDELLERVRDIRSSEKVFYSKVRDIFATSIDYDPSSEACKQFFARVQNKMHWAIHGHTAAEIIHSRADASKQNMGLTNWRNGPKGNIRKRDVGVAKNYLTEQELKKLNLLVDQYLSFAELQAIDPMYMADWMRKLHDFMTLNEREILEHAGKISAVMAKELAQREYQGFSKKRIQDADNRAVDRMASELKKLK